MAKGSNIVTNGLSGNLHDLTFVNSKRYGPHVRSKRGTIKPAKLNAVMEKSSHLMARANVPAKAIFDAVRTIHKDGELWNKLVVIFRQQLITGRAFHIDSLPDLECHEKFTLDKLICSTSYKISHQLQGDSLHIQLSLKTHPDWSYLGWKHRFQYRLSMVIVFPDLKTGRFEREIIHGPVSQFTNPVQPVSFEVSVPDPANEYLLFLLATACENGEAVEQSHVKGMRIVGAGRFE